MGVIRYDEMQYLGEISKNQIGEECYYLFNLSIQRRVFTGYLAVINGNYRLIVYDVQMIDYGGKLYYLSNWKYADIGGEREQLKSAIWVRSEPFVLETNPKESYPMAKTVVELKLSGVNIEIDIYNEHEVKKIPIENSSSYIELMGKYPGMECEVILAIANRLLTCVNEQIHVVH